MASVFKTLVVGLVLGIVLIPVNAQFPLGFFLVVLMCFWAGIRHFGYPFGIDISIQKRFGFDLPFSLLLTGLVLVGSPPPVSTSIVILGMGIGLTLGTVGGLIKSAISKRNGKRQ